MHEYRDNVILGQFLNNRSPDLLIKLKIGRGNSIYLASEQDIRARSIVVSNLGLETKGSQFESRCNLCGKGELSAVIAWLMSKCL